MLRDPPGGRDPQFGNHWSRETVYVVALIVLTTHGELFGLLWFWNKNSYYHVACVLLFLRHYTLIYSWLTSTQCLKLSKVDANRRLQHQS